MRPPRSESVVEVAFVFAAKLFVAVQGNAKFAKSVPATAAMSAPPVVVLRREPLAMLEMVSDVVVASPKIAPVALKNVEVAEVALRRVAKKLVEVALVDVEKLVKRLAIVEEAIV